MSLFATNKRKPRIFKRCDLCHDTTPVKEVKHRRHHSAVRGEWVTLHIGHDQGRLDYCRVCWRESPARKGTGR